MGNPCINVELTPNLISEKKNRKTKLNPVFTRISHAHEAAFNRLFSTFIVDHRLRWCLFVAAAEVTVGAVGEERATASECGYWCSSAGYDP